MQGGTAPRQGVQPSDTECMVHAGRHGTSPERPSPAAVQPLPAASGTSGDVARDRLSRHRVLVTAIHGGGWAYLLVKYGLILLVKYGGVQSLRCEGEAWHKKPKETQAAAALGYVSNTIGHMAGIRFNRHPLRQSDTGCRSNQHPTLQPTSATTMKIGHMQAA